MYVKAEASRGHYYEELLRFEIYEKQESKRLREEREERIARAEVAFYEQQADAMAELKRVYAGYLSKTFDNFYNQKIMIHTYKISFLNLFPNRIIYATCHTSYISENNVVPKEIGHRILYFLFGFAQNS